jgi:hypothetical protein
MHRFSLEHYSREERLLGASQEVCSEWGRTSSINGATADQSRCSCMGPDRVLRKASRKNVFQQPWTQHHVDLHKKRTQQAERISSATIMIGENLGALQKRQ